MVTFIIGIDCEDYIVGFFRDFLAELFGSAECCYATINVQSIFSNEIPGCDGLITENIVTFFRYQGQQLVSELALTNRMM